MKLIFILAYLSDFYCFRWFRHFYITGSILTSYFVFQKYCLYYDQNYKLNENLIQILNILTVPTRIHESKFCFYLLYFTKISKIKQTTIIVLS